MATAPLPSPARSRARPRSRRMDEQAAVVALAALAQTMRLRIFRALVGIGPQGLTPSTLSATLDVPASTLSFHLKELTRAGLVSQERDGRSLIYRASLDRMDALMNYLTAHCCQAVDDAFADPTSESCRRC